MQIQRSLTLDITASDQLHESIVWDRKKSTLLLHFKQFSVLFLLPLVLLLCVVPQKSPKYIGGVIPVSLPFIPDIPGCFNYCIHAQIAAFIKFTKAFRRNTSPGPILEYHQNSGNNYRQPMVKKSRRLFKCAQISLAKVLALYRTSSGCVVFSLHNLPLLKLYCWWAAIQSVARFLLFLSPQGTLVW